MPPNCGSPECLSFVRSVVTLADLEYMKSETHINVTVEGAEDPTPVEVCPTKLFVVANVPEYERNRILNIVENAYELQRNNLGGGLGLAAKPRREKPPQPRAPPGPPSRASARLATVAPAPQAPRAPQAPKHLPQAPKDVPQADDTGRPKTVPNNLSVSRSQLVEMLQANNTELKNDITSFVVSELKKAFAKQRGAAPFDAFRSPPSSVRKRQRLSKVQRQMMPFPWDDVSACPAPALALALAPSPLLLPQL